MDEQEEGDNCNEDSGDDDSFETLDPNIVSQLIVDEQLHKPIDQALGILKQSKQLESAKKFDAFLAGEKGGAVLERYGYVIPKR